ncbi:catecholate siderophore receptor [Endobacter medicaginis]|uniref:Catecholate siderophore receptor n=1 Tax=Endobacter medicaginis TaxID=1181271 RepID=A0A850NTI5_9PROT|nr:TonB-dependent siderophore receptor [Endobacter medicaginis]MBB3173033.1 catecholate siderophore receptor [Endobacter medicaginis]MCX5474542.1 TonB-dependent siderophore receptor [Endobacter medicaginis]NVN31096.1 TonB-dependent siderophore receptor [Endobacter medicaginis]
MASSTPTVGLALAGAWLWLPAAQAATPPGDAAADEGGHRHGGEHHRHDHDHDHDHDHPGTEHAGYDGRVEEESYLVHGVRGYQEKSAHLSRIATRLVDTPQSITVIPQALLKDQGTVNMLQALKTVPGISIAAGEGGQQGDNLSIRGFNAQNDFYRDGMLDFGSYYRDPFDLESIDVLKGPSATLFGRGSTGGVINQTTKAAGGAHTEATAAFGTDGTTRATIDYGRQSSMLGGSAFRLNAMVHDAGMAGIDLARTRRYGIAPSLAFGLNTDTVFRIDYFRQQSFDRQYYGIPWINGSPAPVSRSNYYGYRDDYLRSIVNVGTLRLDHTVNSHLRLRDQLRYSTYNLGQRATEPLILGYSPYQNIVNANVPLSSVNISRNVLALTGPSTLLDNQAEFAADFATFGIRHQMTGGVEVQRQSADITRWTYLPRTTTPLFDPNTGAALTVRPTLRSISGTVSNDVAPYINDTLSFGRHWQVLLGWRWDQYTTEYKQIVAPAVHVTRTDQKPSWRGAIVYHPVDNASVYVSGGTSFDPSGENVSLTASTAAVPPETSATVELGGKWDIGRLSLTSAVYQIQMYNVRETNPADATQTILAGNYRARGFELQASGHITRRWEIFGGYSYNDVVVVSSPNRLELGNSPPNAPKHTVALWTEYHLPWLPMELGAGVNYVSTRTASSLPISGTTVIERAPGYATMQLMAKYQITPRFSGQVNLTNVTDTTYYDALHPSHIVMGPARAALFSFDYKL